MKLQSGVRANQRRKNALARLREQLESGMKKSKDGTEMLPLSKGNRTRIQREIETLKARI